MSSGSQPQEAGIAGYLQTSSWCPTVAWFWGQMTCFPAGHRMSTGTPFPAAKTSGSLLHLTFHTMVTGNWGQGHLESVTGPAAPVPIVSVRFSRQTPSLVGNHLAAAAGFLPRCAGLAQAAWPQCPLSTESPVSHRVCHSCVVTRSCREDGGGVPAPAGELWRVGGAGRASCGQLVWRTEEPRGLCPDDYVLVIFSEILLIFAWLHPWSLLHWEEGGCPGTFYCPEKTSSLGLRWGGRLSRGGTVWKEAGDFLLLIWAHRGISGVPGAGQHQPWIPANASGCGCK